MHWEYGALMALPRHLYVELVDWLNETKPTDVDG